MLEQIPLFSCLDNASRENLQKKAIKRTFPKNAILFSKGDDSDALFLILKGKVKAVILDEEGRELILNIHGPGECIGEVALLDGRTRSATIITKDQTQALIIYRKDFMEIAYNDKETLMKIIHLILERLRLATDKIESLVFQNTHHRLLNFLAQMSEEKDGQRIIAEKLTHHEISNIIGSSREMVSRILKELLRDGYISIEKKRIILHKKFPVLD